MNRLVLVCGAAVGLSLYSLYAVFAGFFLERLVLSTVTGVELAVVLAELIQVAWILGTYRARQPRAEVFVRLFFLDVAAMIFFLMVYIFTASTFWANLFTTVFYTWIAATALVLTPYLVLVSVIQIVRSQDPFQLLLSPALIYGFLAFAATSLVAFSNPFSLADLFPYFVQYATVDLSAGVVPGLSSLYLLIPSVAMLCSLAVRITIPTPTSATPPRVEFVLPLFGVAVSLVWVFAGARAVPNTLLSFTLPGAIIVGLLYAYIRR